MDVRYNGTHDTTPNFLRSFSVINEEDSDYEFLSVPDDVVDCLSDTDDNEPPLSALPYEEVYKPSRGFEEDGRQGWIPNTPVSVKFTNYEREADVSRLNPYLYTITVKHAQFEWSIKRRYKHIHQLHEHLSYLRTRLSIPIPTKKHQLRRRTIRDHKNKVMTRFPKRPEIMVRESQVPKRMEEMEKYLNSILACPFYKENHETLRFFEVSSLSFVKHLGVKRREAMVMKCSGGRRTRIGCCGCLHGGHIASSWKRRWLLVKDSFLTYINPKTGQISDVMLIDSDFSVSSGMKNTGASEGVLITNMSRNLLMKCWTHRKAKEWEEILTDVAASTASDFTSTGRFGSYAPLRDDCYGRWFIDGSSYFQAVADALEKAKSEIFITDWWLSPEVFLKRPMTEGNRWRLDLILKRKAEQGVKIFILLYKEVEMAVGLNSFYTKHTLCAHHMQNIKVMRHPDHIKKQVFLWAHHEKIICIDQRIAFVGGIDLCYGRWDNDVHTLVDLGSVTVGVQKTLEIVLEVDEEEANKEIATGQKVTIEGSYACSKDTDSKTSHNNNGASVNVQSAGDDRNPIVSNMQLNVQPIVKEARGWNRIREVFINRTNSGAGEPLGLKITRQESQPPDQSETQSSSPTGFFGRFRSQLNRAQSTPEGSHQHRHHRFYWHRQQQPPRQQRTSEDEVDKGARFRAVVHAARQSRQRRRIPNMDTLELKLLRSMNIDSAENQGKSFADRLFPWNQPPPEAKELDLSPSSATSLSEGCVDTTGLTGGTRYWIGKDYCNFIYKDPDVLDKPFEDYIDRRVMQRMPWHDIASVVYGKAARDVARHFIGRWNFTKLEKAKYDAKYPFLVPMAYDNIPVPLDIKKIMYNVKVQVLRSSGQWSAGISNTESSIHSAYLSSITNAKYFIYIENQFFISLIDHPTVSNQIAETLCERIIRAHRNGETFRVYVMMPLLPGIEGEFGTGKGFALKAITHWNYASISRGPYSLMEHLRKEIPDPTQYISFYGVRKHDELRGEPVTELIYVHSKMLIVDDDTVIIGSANINDRSMMGHRDSEVAVIYQDKHKFEVTWNGVLHKAGYFASSLRRTVFREHMGLAESDTSVDISDPLCDTFYKDIWMRTASRNTGIYDRVFNCIPTDKVLNFAQLEELQQKTPLAKSDRAEAREQLSKVKGYLVLLPLLFLLNEDLTPPINSKEGLLPDALWT